MKPEEIEKDKIRLTISFGMASIFIGLLKYLQTYITSEGPLSFLFLVYEGVFTVSILCLVIYVILTAAKYKAKNPGTIDDDLYISEKFRNHFYDYAIDGLAIGLFNAISMTAYELLSRYVKHEWMGITLAIIIALIIKILLTSWARSEK